MSYGVTVPEVDAAMAARYAGMAILVGDPAVLTPVEVFIEEPSSEEFPERVFPSVTVKLVGMIFDLERAHTSDDEHEEEEISYNVPPTVPPEREMRRVPIPYRLQYRVETWHRVRTAEDRDLVFEAIVERTHPRGSLLGVGANTSDLWALWSGGVANLDAVEVDEVVFHKTLTVEVLADVIPTTDTVRAKVVTELRMQVQHVERDPGTGELDLGTAVTDLVVAFDDVNEGPV